MAKLPETIYPALQKFVMKGIGSKASARDAHSELDQLIDELTSLRDQMDDSLCKWEEGEDAEERAEGKDELEQVISDLDDPLSQAGFCAGQKPFEAEENDCPSLFTEQGEINSGSGY